MQILGRDGTLTVISPSPCPSKVIPECGIPDPSNVTLNFAEKTNVIYAYFPIGNHHTCRAPGKGRQHMTA